jgi:hypothetical protein
MLGKHREEERKQHKDFLDVSPHKEPVFFFFLEKPAKPFFFFSREYLALLAS